MKLLAELNPRHVFRVAIGYVVASWLVLQTSDVVPNNISAAPWVGLANSFRCHDRLG